MELKEAYKFYKEGRIKRISDRMFQIGEQSVMIHIKQGRRILTCRCDNHARFPIESFCYHKELIFLLPLFEHFDKQLSDLKILIGMAKNQGEINTMIDNIWRFK